MKAQPHGLAPESEELLRLDALRFVASAAIVIFHYKTQLDLPPAGVATVARLDGLEAAVDLFFFISGFVIARFYGGLASRHEYGVFLWKRMARLYPLHLATALFYVMIALLAPVAGLQFKHPEQFDLTCLPANLMLVHSLGVCPHLSLNAVSWSISAEMLLYVGFPAVLLLRRWPHALGLFGVAMFVLLSVLPQTDGWSSWTYSGGLVRAVPSFVLGAFCFYRQVWLSRLPFAANATWLILAAALLAIVLHAPGAVVIGMLYLAAACAIAADRQAPAGRTIRFAAAGGTLTYSLYMLHPIVDLALTSFVGKRLLRLEGLALDLWVALAFVAALALSYVSWRFFEMPARRWMTGLVDRRTARASPAERHLPL